MKTINQNPLAMKGKLLLMMLLFFIQVNKLHASNYYWVGGTGDWTDVSHWATTSGGTTFHTAPPNSTSDVFIDVNSGNGSPVPFLLTAWGISPACKNLTFNDSMAIMAYGDTLNIFGSFFLTRQNVPATNSLPIGFTVAFVGAGINSINSTINKFNALDLVFNCPNGTYNLFCNLGVQDTIKVLAGNVAFSGMGAFPGDVPTLVANALTGESININFGSSFYQIISVVISNLGLAGSFIADSSGILYQDYFICNARGAKFGTVENFYGLQPGPGVPLQADSCFFKSIIVNTVEGTGNTIDSLVVQSLISDNSLAYLGKNKVRELSAVIGFLSFGSQNQITDIGSLYTNFLTISSGDTLYFVNSASNSIPGNWHSSVSGQPAYIHCNSPSTSCFQNTSIQDIHLTGSAVFYGDTSSTDVSGNAGWIWAPCSPTSVWPGDANYDLTVNNIDVLNIGLAYSNTGPVRAGASLAYVAQPATDWNGFFQTAVNHKHADTNGDGVVNDDDTTAVSLNYGLTHPARMGINACNTSALGIPLYLDIQPDSAALSDTVDIDVMLGTAAMPVDSIYGLVFTLNFDTAYVDTAYITSDYSLSWMGTMGVDLLCFDKKFAADGKVDVAITRTDQNNTNGFGSVARFTVVIVDNVSGRVSVPFTLSNVYAITAWEDELLLDIHADSISIDTTTGTAALMSMHNIHVYPNPAKDILKIKGAGHEMMYAELMDAFGRKLLSTDKTRTGELTLHVQKLNKGIYTLNVTTEMGVIKKKIMKQ